MNRWNGSRIGVEKSLPGGSGLWNLASQSVFTDEGSWPSLENCTNQMVSIANRIINTTSQSDYNGSWDVSETFVPVNFSGSARIYIGAKITTVETYYSDWCVAAVQIVNNAGDTVMESWVFHLDSQAAEWETPHGRIAGTSTVGYPATLSTLTAQSYYQISTSVFSNRWIQANGTATYYTGANGGIQTTYTNDNATLLPVGNGTVPKYTSSTRYLFTEASTGVSPGGFARYSSVAMRSPSYNFSGGERIRVCHVLVQPDPSINSNGQGDPNDSLYLGVA